MKNKRWILIIISVFVFVFTVLGVWWYVNYSVKRTAEGETSFFVDENEDLMVGVYITEEPLKNDNFRYLAEEKEIGEFQFNTGVKGYGCFQYKTDDGEGSFVGSVGDEIFCDCGVMFETKSFFNKKCYVNGTVYWMEENDLYIYSVYQSSDGQIYFSSDIAEDGAVLLRNSDGNDDVIKYVYEDKARGNSIEPGLEMTVEITFKRTEKIEEIRISQMTEDNELLKVDAYSAKELPEEYVPERNAEYLTVEMISENGEICEAFGTVTVEREYEIKLYDMLNNGIYAEKHVSVKW